jgi:hypothetical protein
MEKLFSLSTLFIDQRHKVHLTTITPVETVGCVEIMLSVACVQWSLRLAAVDQFIMVSDELKVVCPLFARYVGQSPDAA